jgi:hypothetical protein
LNRSLTARLTGSLLVGLACASSPARSADEIQVYNAEINRPRQFSLQMHGNFIVRGLEEPDFPGGLVADGSFNGTPEFAYGVLDWWEVGAYLPYAIEPGPSFFSGGAKLRTLFVSPNAAQRRFFYGLNIEIARETEKFSPGRWGSEVRPIVGWRWPRVEFIVNPIVEVPLSGPEGDVLFAPAVRLAWLATPSWAFGFEHYAELGPWNDFVALEEQAQELFAVADRTSDAFDANFGVGHGFTGSSNDWTVKGILSWSF